MQFHSLSRHLTALTAILSLAWVHHAAADETRWFKGNLHTHTLWSDGDSYPEVIINFYKTNGYHFLALSDHNIVQTNSEHWINVTNSRGNTNALAVYLQQFGADWVEQRTRNGTNEVRLKTFNEFRPRFEDKDKFLLMLGEEVSDRHLSAPIHMNVSNVRELIQPQGGTSVTDVIQNNVNAVLAQRKKTGQPMIPHLNHPNFQWAITAEEMLPVKGEKFFEVYNGHPGVRNEGDATHASTERIWDILLTRRLSELKLEPFFGIGTDDSHHYLAIEPNKSNPGRGWVMVNAKDLSAKSLIKAMEAGDFYASSGVTLKSVQRGPKVYALEIEPNEGVTYTTQFIGTRKGYDPKNEPVLSENGTPLRVTHRYSKDIGVVLAEVKGTSASYKLKGDEIYVRAKIISSQPMNNTAIKDEVERAWTQPLVP